MTQAPTTLTVPLYRVQRGHRQSFASTPPPGPVRRPARVAIMLALAHHIRRAIVEGRVESQADAAQRLRYTPARLSQLLDLLLLAPDIQEQVLLMEAVDGVQPVRERLLRPIVKLTDWRRQRIAFVALIANASEMRLRRLVRGAAASAEAGDE